MTRYRNSRGYQQRAPKPRRRGFLFLLMAVVTMWAVSFIATEAPAASRPMENVGAIVHKSNFDDSVQGKNLKFQALEYAAASSQLSACYGESKGHRYIPGCCPSSCVGVWDALSANRVLLLPENTFLTMQFAPLVTGSVRSLLYQRLNRPPIAGISA